MAEIHPTDYIRRKTSPKLCAEYNFTVGTDGPDRYLGLRVGAERLAPIRVEPRKL